MATELNPFNEICTGRVEYMTEGSYTYVFMEGLHFIAKGAQKCMDALLCLNYSNPTYPTKLFLPENLGLGLNWNENAYILARQWFTWSWKDVPQTLTPYEILAAHLRAFQ